MSSADSAARWPLALCGQGATHGRHRHDGRDDEEARGARRLGVQEANMIFKEADINQDGKITLDEFKKVMASHDLT